MSLKDEIEMLNVIGVSLSSLPLRNFTKLSLDSFCYARLLRLSLVARMCANAMFFFSDANDLISFAT